MLVFVETSLAHSIPYCPSPTLATIPPRMAIGPIQLLQQATPGQRRTLLAASLGWMLDSFDAMLYALVLAHVMRDLGMTKAPPACSLR